MNNSNIFSVFSLLPNLTARLILRPVNHFHYCMNISQCLKRWQNSRDSRYIKKGVSGQGSTQLTKDSLICYH